MLYCTKLQINERMDLHGPTQNNVQKHHSMVRQNAVKANALKFIHNECPITHTHKKII